MQRVFPFYFSGLLLVSGFAGASPPVSVAPASAKGDVSTERPAFRFSGPLAEAQTLFRTGKTKECKQRAEKLRKTLSEPKLRDAVEALWGLCTLRLGEVSAVTTQLGQFVKQNPMALSARYMLGESHRLAGQRDQERAIWNGFFDDHDADKLDLNDARTVRLLGQAAYRLGSYPDAAEQLKNAAELAQQHKETEEQVLSLLELSALRIEKYQVGYAERSVLDALRLDPENPDGKAILAEIKLEQGNEVSPASELLEQALSVNPDHSHANFLKARILVDNEQYEEALSVVKPQLERNANDLRARAMRAAALWLLDRKAEYEQEKTETLRRSPIFTDFFRIVSERLHVQHRYETQISVLEEAVSVNPKDHYAWGMLGQAYLQVGDDKKGYETLQKAWKGDRFNHRTYNLLELFEKHLLKNYKLITADLDETKKGGLQIRFHKEEAELLGPLVIPFVQALYVEFSRRYQFSPKWPITLELYKEPENFSVRTFGLPSVDPGLLGVTFSRLVTGRSPSQQRIPWGLMVWHELGHVFAIELSQGRVPRWFTEGLSEWETMQLYPGWSRRTHAEVAKALRDGKLLSMADLNVGFTRARSQNHIVVAYHQAALSIEYLASRFGFPKIVEALRLFGKGMRTREVLEKISGLPIAQLDRDFQLHLSKKLSVYQQSFYIRPTDYSDWEGLKEQSAKEPNNARLYGLMAIGRTRAGGEPKAIQEWIAAAKKIDPRCKEAILAEGELQQRLGKAELAEKAYLELIAVGGDGFDVRQRLGDLYVKLERFSAAIAEYERAKKLDPDRAEPYLRLAAIYEKDKKEEASLRELAVASLLEISDEETLFALIDGHANKKRFKDVILYADRLLYVRPFSATLRKRFGEAWLHLEEPKRALFHLHAAQKLLPELSEVDDEELPKLKSERRQVEELIERTKQTKEKPFSGPSTLLDTARKKAGLPLGL